MKVCHNMLDQTVFAVNAHISPRLSKKFHLSIEHLLRAGLTVKAILQNHMDEVVSKFRKDHPDEEECRKWSCNCPPKMSRPSGRLGGEGKAIKPMMTPLLLKFGCTRTQNWSTSIVRTRKKITQRSC